MLAVLYDIHGNLVALDEVLKDADAAGADSYLLGGDFASWSPWPLETIERGVEGYFAVEPADFDQQ